MVIDFRHNKNLKDPVKINGNIVDSVNSYKYLGCIIQDNFKWDKHIEMQTKKCNKRQFLLRRLNELHVDSNILTLYYNSMISSVLTYVIGSWFNACGVTLSRALEKVEKRAKRVIKQHFHYKLITPVNVYNRTSINSAEKIIEDETHPLHFLFKFLPHGIRLLSPLCRTNRYQTSPVPSFIHVFNNQDKLCD